jgi:hypothetical protein
MVAATGTEYMKRTLANYGTHAVGTFAKRIRQQRYNSEHILSYLNSRAEAVGDTGKLIFTLSIRQRFMDMNSRSKVYNRPVLWYYYQIAENLQSLYGTEASEILNNNLNNQ